MTPGFADNRATAARGCGLVALLLGLLAAPGCRESPFGPDMPENNVVVDDGRDYGDDPYEVNSAAIDGDRLTISVSFAGGCRNHIFTLVISKSFTESDPVQLPAVLAHDANGDTCEAYPTESASSTSPWSGRATGSSTDPVRGRSSCESPVCPVTTSCTSSTDRAGREG